MIFEPMQLAGCVKIIPKVVKDDRGEFVKTYIESELAANGLHTDFKEEYYSRSKKDVLRGMHFQTPPCGYVKLLSCPSGCVRDVLLDIRVGSPTYGHHQVIELDGSEPVLLYLPAGIAHGFAVLSEFAVVTYKVSCEYAPSHDCGIRWDSFGADWNIDHPQVSPRDAAFPRFEDFNSPFTFHEG